MFKSKTLRYETVCDVQLGDGEFVFYTLYEVKQWYFIAYYKRIQYGLQKEMTTLCENLNKKLKQPKFLWYNSRINQKNSTAFLASSNINTINKS